MTTSHYSMSEDSRQLKKLGILPKKIETVRSDSPDRRIDKIGYSMKDSDVELRLDNQNHHGNRCN